MFVTALQSCLKIALPNSTPINELFMISESQLWLWKPTHLIALRWEQGILESSLELCLKVHTTVFSLQIRLWGHKYTIKWQTYFVANSVAPKFSNFLPIWCNSESKFNSLQHKLANYLVSKMDGADRCHCTHGKGPQAEQAACKRPHFVISLKKPFTYFQMSTWCLSF